MILEVLHDDALERVVALEHLVHAKEAERHPLAARVLVADDDDAVPSGIEHWRDTVDDFAKRGEEVLGRSRRGEVARLIREPDYVMIRRVEDGKLSACRATLPEQRAEVRLSTVCRDDLRPRRFRT